MVFFELFLIAVGVSMDSFAVSVGKGMAVGKARFRHILSVGLWFGGFQALMTLAGYFLGSGFYTAVESIDHWIAFGLLLLIGLNMIRESVKNEEKDIDASFSFAKMLVLAIATSIDALACGLSFAFLDTGIWSAALIIGTTTFVFSAAGLMAGSAVGRRFRGLAGIVGGVILTCIGTEILVKHLFF